MEPPWNPSENAQMDASNSTQWRMNATGIHKRTLCGRQWPHSPALCSRYFGFVRPVPFLQSHIVTWCRAIPFPCASLGTRSRIMSHGFLWQFHSPASRSGHGVLWQFHSPASRSGYGVLSHGFFMASPFPCVSLGTGRILLQIGSYSSESHVV